MCASASTSLSSRALLSVLGSLIGDASSIGVHWIYGENRIREVFKDRSPAFIAPNKDFYRAGGPDYFAHGKKHRGDNTHYGEGMMVLLRSLAATRGILNVPHYIAAFKEHFGFGGSYSGYVDHAMAGTLLNIIQRENPLQMLKAMSYSPSAAALSSSVSTDPKELSADLINAICVKIPPLIRQVGNDNDLLRKRVRAAIEATHNYPVALEYGDKCVDHYLSAVALPVGGDDHQMNALAKMAPIAAALTMRGVAETEFDQQIAVACRTTQNSDLAVAWVLVAMNVLREVILGRTPKEAVLSVVEKVEKAASVSGSSSSSFSWSSSSIPAEVPQLVRKAVELSSDWKEDVCITGTFGLACFLRMGVPSSFHVLLRATSYRWGVERCLLDGGDSAGRAAFVGAVLGAHFGLADGNREGLLSEEKEVKGIPVDWLLAAKGSNEVVELVRTITKHVEEDRKK